MLHIGPVTDDIAQLSFDLGRCLRQKMLQCSDSGMHIPQMHALLFIQSKPGITMKELAGLLRVTSPSTTSFVDRLVKLGHVRRARDVTNRKLVRLYLTDEGETSLKVTMEKRRDMLLDILSVLSPSEQESLRTVMQKLIANCSL